MYPPPQRKKTEYIPERDLTRRSRLIVGSNGPVQLHSGRLLLQIVQEEVIRPDDILGREIELGPGATHLGRRLQLMLKELDGAEGGGVALLTQRAQTLLRQRHLCNN